MHLLLSFPDHLAAETAFIAHASNAEVSVAPAMVAANDDDDSGNSALAGVIQLLLFGGIAVAFYFLMIRPRRRMLRETQQLQSSIDVGDEVLLTSGVYGFITGMEEGTDVVWVEIDDDVQVRVTRAAISRKVDTTAAVDASATESNTRPAPKGGTSTPASDVVSTESTARPTLKGGSSAPATPPAEPVPPVDE